MTSRYRRLCKLHKLRNRAVSPRRGAVAWGSGDSGPGPIAARGRRHPRASRQDDRRIVGVGPVQQQRVAEHLGHLAVRPPRDRLGGVVAIELGRLAELHLHQLMIDERLLDRGDHAIVDATLPDLHDRLQLVTQSAEMTTLLAGEHGRLYPKMQTARRIPGGLEGTLGRNLQPGDATMQTLSTRLAPGLTEISP